MDSDHTHIERAFRLALRGVGRVSPNPLVGAVLVKKGTVIGEGFHEYHGGPHAEVNAIRYSVENPEGATLYSNLEPCCHRNKLTPPCIDAIIKNKISRVVVSNIDPNPEVGGKGLESLRKAGVEVVQGILESEGKILNEIFFKFITTSKPFVHIKMAQTLDGKLCGEDKTSQWISGEVARKQVHLLRKKYDAVLVGRGTYNNDNPRLTCRVGNVVKEQQPYRIVVGDPRKMNLDFYLFNDEYKDKTMIASTVETKKIPKEMRAFNIIEVGSKEGKYFWHEFWMKLASKKISSILVEGGPQIIDSVLQEEQWDKMTSFIAPKILGNGPSFFHSSFQDIKQAISLKRSVLEKCDGDMMVSGYRE